MAGYDIGLPLSSVKDCNLDYNQKRVWLPPIAFVQGQVTGASTLITTDAAGVVGTLTNPVAGLSWVKFTATTENTDTMWRIPYDVDNKHAIRFRIYWTSDFATANGTATFRILYTSILPNVLPAVGATALTSAIAVSTKTSATADVPYWTSYGVLGPLSTGSLAYMTLDPRAEFLALRINVNAVGGGLTLATNFVYMLGMEIAYTPHQTFGDGSRREARWMESNLAFNAADPAVQPQ